MGIDSRIKDNCKICMKKNCQSENMWVASIYSQYMHPYMQAFVVKAM